MSGQGVEHNTLKTVDFDFVCEEGPSDNLKIYRLRFSEEINGHYDLDVDLVTDERNADTDMLLGASCQVDIRRGDHSRTIFGIIMALDYIGPSEDSLFVNVRIVPAFFLLQQQTHSRIFQDLSVMEILAEVLGPELRQYGRTLDRGSRSRGWSPRDYCVQYRESDMDFCMRLMEEEGISHHFVHDEEQGHEVLTLTYDNSDFTDVTNVDGTAVIPIIVARPETAELESIRSLDYLQTLTTTSAMRRDYDFATPLEPLTDLSEGVDAKGYTRRMYVHTDRRYISDDVAERRADHLEAQQVRGKVGRGSGNVIDFAAGKVFELERHVRDDLETQYLITRVVHTGEAPETILATGGSSAGSGQPRYRNSFQCIPLDVPMRPKHRTPKPRSLGPETGIVSGPSGEEIHVDEHGRIKVQFHWEEQMSYDHTASAWIRVRQTLAGPGWGFQFIPRVGQEVVVEFLGGNIDRPLVTGAVYNGDNAPPYTLPNDKTQSGIKTDTVSGDGSNELRFEDMAGCEEVYIHCQKDFTIATENDKNQTTGNDETLAIANDRTKEVGHDQKETVKNDKTITVEGKHTETIVKDMKLTVQGNRSGTVVKNDDITVVGDRTITIGKSDTLRVATTLEQSIGGAKTVHVGAAHNEIVGAARTIAAGGALTMTAGGMAQMQSAEDLNLVADAVLNTASSEDLNARAGAKLTMTSADDMALKSDKATVIEASDQLTLKVGSAKLVLKANGDITFNGKKIGIKGSGPVTIKGTKVDFN